MANTQQRAKPWVGAAGTKRVAALDIGCAKVSCLIARAAPTGGFDFAGGGWQRSRGFVGGAITDMEGLERSVRLAVEDAERAAGESIDSVSLGVSGPKILSRFATASTETSGREISARDMRRVINSALSKVDTKHQRILSAHPIAYRVDDQPGVKQPVGMIGSRLGVCLNVVTAPSALVANLVECVNRAHLNIDSLVPSSVASAHGTLIEDERENGAVCIDMGAGVTSVCVYLNGAPAWVDYVKVGGAHVTADIAQGVGTTFAAAERFKTIYGTADIDAPNAGEKVECPILGDDGRLTASRLAKRDLAAIIAPRIEETFELVRDRLAASKLAKVSPRRLVLTGGASQLHGVRDIAARTLGMPVRLGRPTAADSLGETYATPAFSTASGLLTFSLSDTPNVVNAGRDKERIGWTPRIEPLNRALSWLRENF